MAFVALSGFGLPTRVALDFDSVVIHFGTEGRVGLSRDEAERLVVALQNALAERPQAVTA